ncbi:MAG TPA: D-alanine--D-alanine ligase [Firmicutes bacterium]|nr:D-alanine--D-alanine ligase [Bacillota bacterium]
MPKLKIAVIYGGRSGEHEVSLASAESIMAALDQEKYEIMPIKIEKNGKWKNDLIIQPDPTLKAGFDVAFPVLHGPYGEDGTIQGLFEMAGIPYVGAGVTASAAAMDKSVMRDLFAQAGLPLVPWVVAFRHEWEADSKKVVKRIEETLGYPVFVKPANLGSSVGISKVASESGLAEAITLALQYDRKIVVEEGVKDAREIECSVLGHNRPRTSVLGEVIPGNEFYDYMAKYHSEDSRLIIPAPLSAELTGEIRSLAKRAFQAVDCSGMGRVDFLLAGTGEVYLNEINTIPGFTEISMYPKLWEASGLSYSALLDQLIEIALEKHGEKQRLKTSAF